MNGIAVVPPDDYSFIESNGSVIRARTVEELYKALEAYRSTNGLDPGRVEAEVDQAIEERNGRMVGVTPPPPAFQVSTVDAPKGIRERVTQWASNRFVHTTREIEYVLPDEADHRGAVCANCKYNQNWKISCPSCVENNDRVLLLLNRGQRVKDSTRVSACDFYGHEINTACFLPEELLRHRAQKPEGPDVPCWVKELDND